MKLWELTLVEHCHVHFKGESLQELKDVNKHNPTVIVIGGDLLIYLYRILYFNI
jgi:hypothetical protein